jgi:outer membrane assembly lipoprotein YfiO
MRLERQLGILEPATKVSSQKTLLVKAGKRMIGLNLESAELSKVLSQPSIRNLGSPDGRSRFLFWIAIRPMVGLLILALLGPGCAGPPQYTIEEARRKIEVKDFGSARSDLSQWIVENPKHARTSEAVVLRAQVNQALGDYSTPEPPMKWRGIQGPPPKGGALWDYEYLIRHYPASQYYNDALQGEYEIADQFLQGTPRKFFGIRSRLFFFTSQINVGEELMIRIQERAPGSALGERASLRLAKHYFDQKSWGSAIVTYEMFLINYPRSVQRPSAMRQLILSHQSNYLGSDYDATSLAEAEQWIKQYRKEFPAQSVKLKMAQEARAMHERQADKAYETAHWYEKRSKIVSARYMYDRVIRRYPTTKAAETARQRLQRLGGALALGKAKKKSDSKSIKLPVAPSQEGLR